MIAHGTPFALYIKQNDGRNYMNYARIRRAEQIKAAIFSSFLLLLTFSLLCIALSQNQKLIIGSEMNGNGTVEYLCLGDNCANLNDY